MIFKKLTLENYKSFQFPTQIVFPVSTREKPLFLVGGMNGAGKSTIMEAIHLCLYGGKVEQIVTNINRTSGGTPG
jgi:DNA sulfur modification protein DndD